VCLRTHQVAFDLLESCRKKCFRLEDTKLMSKDWLKREKQQYEQNLRLKEYLMSNPQALRVKGDSLWAQLKEQLVADVAEYNTLFNPRIEYIAEGATPTLIIRRAGYPKFELAVTREGQYIVFERKVKLASDGHETKERGHFEIRLAAVSLEPSLYSAGQPLNDLTDATEMLLRPHIEELNR
jgi:hypothetical protein